MNWPDLASMFSFIFLAALPGRTTFVMLLLATRARPFPLLFGAALAFAIQAAISVSLGELVSVLPSYVIHGAAGILFLYFAYRFWQESYENDAIDHGHFVEDRAFRSTFLLIFAAEWGDISQVAIATKAAEASDRAAVFLCAVAALWTIAGLAIAIGALFGKMFSPRILQRFAAVGFFATGAFLLTHAFLSRP